MLPQRTVTKPSSPNELPVASEREDAPGPATRAKVRQSSKPLEVQRGPRASMLPPSTTGRLSSMRELPQTRQASQRASRSSSLTSTSNRKPSQDVSAIHAKPALSNDPRKTSVDKQSSMHERSVSQQVSHMPRSGISMLPPNTSSLQQPASKAKKPAFSAMQQHYSPKKDPNCLPPKDKMAPKALLEGDSSEISNLRVELSQLHMLHRSAASVQGQWEESAKNSFRTRFDDLCMRHAELKEIAHQQRILLNQLALVEWCQGIPSAHVAEKVQQVSRNMADIRSLLEPDGKYSRVLDLFGAWFTRASQIESSRDKDTIFAQRQDLSFIDGIGDGWKAEAMVLERELTYCLRELKGFGEIRAVSSLGRMLSLHKTLVLSLLEELDVTQWIENEIMEHEGTWMEQTINKLSSNVSSNI